MHTTSAVTPRPPGPRSTSAIPQVEDSGQQSSPYKRGHKFETKRWLSMYRGRIFEQAPGYNIVCTLQCSYSDWGGPTNFLNRSSFKHCSVPVTELGMRSLYLDMRSSCLGMRSKYLGMRSTFLGMRFAGWVTAQSLAKNRLARASLRAATTRFVY